MGLRPVVVVEAAVAHQIVPSPVPLRGPHLGQVGEYVIVRDLDGVAPDHDVQSGVPLVAAGGQGDMRVGPEVDGLLLSGTGAEVEGPIGPDRNQRRDVRPAAGPDGGDPEQLGRFQHLAGLIPSGGDRVRSTDPLVKGGHWGSHRHTSRSSAAAGLGAAGQLPE